MMNDNCGWVPGVFLSLISACLLIYIVGWTRGTTNGRNQGIIYCMEQPEKCKIEFQYLKLTEKSK